MRPSPLIIENYFVKKVQFELNPGFDRSNLPSSEDIEPKIKVNLESEKYPEDRNSWRFELSVDSNNSEEDSPFTFSVKLVGVFRVDENYPAEGADLLAQVNAPSVLYSAARELLVNVTGRSSYSPILLPSISFFPEPEEEPKKKSAAKKTKSKK